MPTKQPSSVTITKKMPLDIWQHQQAPVQKKLPLHDRMQDVKDNMVIRLMKKKLEEEFEKKNEEYPSNQIINDNLQPG